MSRTAIEGGGKSFDLSDRFVFSNNRRLRIRSFKEHRGLVFFTIGFRLQSQSHVLIFDDLLSGFGIDRFFIHHEEKPTSELARITMRRSPSVAWRTSQASAENEEFCLSSIRMQTHVHLSAANQEHLSGWVKSRSLWHFCDPNPSEQSSHTLLSFTGDYTSLNLNNGSFLGPVGRIQLSVLKASQLPKNCECASNNRSKKVTKTCCLEILLRTINVPDTESVETDSLCRISTASCFQGPVGRIQSSVLKASQLPKNGECASNNRSKKRRTRNAPDIESVETDSLCRISTASCFQGPVGRIQSSVLKASQLPKNGECASNNRSKKRRTRNAPDIESVETDSL
ncbi:putative protein [Arabidopsis thaliana]|uniref:Uncharacterized protein T22P11_260 n=1 Tax=Arabidopsis thaliana TaxID=3702 RepID=Q9LZ35_ARATH|nr:putative protein [Arabidopsis thaliana]